MSFNKPHEKWKEEKRREEKRTEENRREENRREENRTDEKTISFIFINKKILSTIKISIRYIFKSTWGLLKLMRYFNFLY